MIKPGDIFPKMSFDLSSNKKAQEYLGLRRAKEIEIQEINADLVIVEVLSVYCVSCMSQTAYDKELYAMIEENKSTAGKVKMIGIAVGNNLREVSRFVDEFEVPYPVFTDFKFLKYDQIGQVRTPFKIFLLKESDQKYYVIRTEVGLREDVKKTFGTIVSMLDGKYSIDQKQDMDATKIASIEQGVVDDLLKEWLSQKGESLVIKKLFIESGMTVFEIGRKKQFAVLINRVSICDVCKEVQFIYIIDSLGNVVDLLPIHLSKLYNERFNDEDIKKIRGLIISRNVRENIPFNPGVDAVTSATITSSLLNDSINKGAQIYDLLLEKGLIQ